MILAYAKAGFTPERIINTMHNLGRNIPKSTIYKHIARMHRLNGEWQAYERANDPGHSALSLVSLIMNVQAAARRKRHAQPRGLSHASRQYRNITWACVTTMVRSPCWRLPVGN